MAERKKKQQHHEPPSETVRPESASVGETLRIARLAKKLELDDVSHAIHIRPSQLKAIEENNIDQLPGMTYAVGFVRSYANFLGLNGAEIVHRFKAEQGHSPAQSRLSFPEPIVESRVPDPMMVGVGAFLAVVILVVWTIYSNVHGSKTAAQIPPAPVVTSVADTLPAATTPAPDAAPAAAPTTTAPDQTATATPAPAVPAAPAATAAVPTAPVATDTVAGQPASPAVPAATAVPAVTQAMPAATDKAAPGKTTDKTAAAPVKDAAASDDSEDSQDSASADNENASAKAAADKKDSTIKIKAGKSRITLKASLPSWVQVTDGQQNVLYRKVLRPGEQYAVPDQPGLVLDTANAGGISIVVDGAPVQPVGKTGEIVRGVALDPKALKVKRVLVRD
jgi:cytoskeleton protein RodZ